MNRLQLMRLIADITPKNLTSYLLKNQWLNDGAIEGKACVWHRPEKENYNFEVIQPTDLELRNFRQIMQEAVDSIAEFEKRSTHEVADDILNFFSDLVKVRVIHHDVEKGTIPLDDGVLLIEKSKDLLIASTLSTFKKKKYFSGSRSTDVQEFVSKLRLGQTDTGSFIINLISPIDTDHSNQEFIDKTSLTRSVITNLSKSLKAVHKAIDSYINDENTHHLDHAVREGVSANLCDALIGLSGSLKSRRIEISIKLAGFEENNQGIPLTHYFDPKSISALEFASDYYKGSFKIESYTAAGLVTKMKHIQDDEFGEITVKSLVYGANKNISIQLNMDDYWDAVHAHESGSIVTCSGKLIVTPKTATLIDPVNFKANKPTGIFDKKI